MNNLYLAHHGILGQKWGVRRYQNKDGSRTSLGKRHRQDLEGIGELSDAELRKRVDRLQREQRYANAKSKMKRSAINGNTVDTVSKVNESSASIIRNAWGKETAKKVSKLPTSAIETLRSATNTERYFNEADAAKRKQKAYSELEGMSDEELNRLLQRIELEQRYTDLVIDKANVEAGKGKAVRVIGGTAAAAGTIGGAIMTGKAVVEAGKFLYKVIKKRPGG